MDQIRHPRAVLTAFLAAVTLTAGCGAPQQKVPLHAPPTPARTITTPGSHWYYRIDRATKRQCWYLGEAKDKAARAAPETSSRSAGQAAPPAPSASPTPPAPSSVSNAASRSSRMCAPRSSPS